MSRNLTAFAVGVGIIAVLSTVAMTALYFDIAFGLLMWSSLVLAGFVTAAMATNRKLLFAALLALPAALLFALENFLWQLAGKPADLSGLEGSVIVILVSIPFGASLCVVGGAVGWFITRGSTHDKRLQPIASEDARSG